MVKKASKNSTGKKDFYLTLLDELKLDTNLSRIKKKLEISKQQLNYYLRQLKNLELIQKKAKGWYEVKKASKNSTNHGTQIRGHAYVWKIDLPEEIKGLGSNWKNRIQVLESKGIHLVLVGALKNTPRIKVLGRKIWLCNDCIRIYDKANASYYGKDAIQAKRTALREFYDIVRVLENKLGFSFKPLKFEFQKEHYAIVKNELATEMNKKGEILRVSDETGEWLLVDDSLGLGGELENVGKKAFETNPKVQEWYNDLKKHNFELTTSKTLEIFKHQSEITENLTKQIQSLSNELNNLKTIPKLDLNKDLTDIRSYIN